VDADESLAETLILLISELVTNAVVHTGCPAVLCILLPRRCGAGPECGVPGSVRVEVADASSRAPRRRLAEGEDTGGRGLELVSGLADRWGWEHEPGGKRVWCELDTAPLEVAAEPTSTAGGTAGTPTEARFRGEPGVRGEVPIPGEVQVIRKVHLPDEVHANGDLHVSQEVHMSRETGMNLEAQAQAQTDGMNGVNSVNGVNGANTVNCANGANGASGAVRAGVPARARVNVAGVGAGAFG
jgi:anti-sigma regulatory factor (Ser/Thr protein kinase)